MKLILSLLILTSLQAIAGTESSGGGPGIVCRDRDNNIQSVELLDLYEGKIRYKLNIQKSSVHRSQQIKNAISRLSQRLAFQDTVRIAAGYIIKQIDFLPEGVVLDTPSDLGDGRGVVIPNGCRIEAIGYYEETGELKVSKTLYDKLVETDKAAFILHEAIYAVYRQEGEKDSGRTRRLNAVLFASNTSDDDILELTQDFTLNLGPHEVISVPADDLEVKFKIKTNPGVKFEASIDCSSFAYIPFTGSTLNISGKGSKSVTTSDLSGCPQNHLRVKRSTATPVTFEIFSKGKSIKKVTVRADKYGQNYGFQLRFPNLSLPEIP